MPKLVLHKIDGSPPVRSVLMTMEVLGLEAESVEVNTILGDQKKPEFVAKNPMHTIPVLEDGDFILSDSHAIITYLVSKYGADKRQDLYSSDFALRATIDQRMYFDATLLFPFIRSIVKSLAYDGAKEPSAKDVEGVEESYSILEKYLEKSSFLAHSRLTLADISIVASVSSLECFVPVSAERFPRLTDWLNRMKDTDFYKKANLPGLTAFGGFMANLMNKTS